MCFSVTIRTPSFQEYPLNTDAAGTAPPDAFGPFRVLHQIGAGALGPVFRAYQPEQDRLVAVKLFRIDLLPERAHQLVAQLERLIAADLSHPAIAAPLASGLSDLSAYLAMDFVAADSLDIVIRDQQVPDPADVARVATQLANALDLAAAINITHGALHPRDVLLSADDVRMTGIGITRALEAVGASAPIRRPYTAPERAAGASWDRRADVFSLAALIFELLTRRRILGPGDQPLDVFSGVARGHADVLGRVFDRALAERASDRFATAGDFAKALQAAVDKRSVSGRVGASIRPPAQPAEPVVPPPAPTAVEELPLFTDSMLGGASERPAAADVSPPPTVDASHEALAPDLSFRDAPLSMVESLHEPETVPSARGHEIDEITSVPHEPTGRPLTIDDFNPAAHDPAPPMRAIAPTSIEHLASTGDLAITRHQPEFDIEEVFASEVPEPPTRQAPFESFDDGRRPSSGVWPLMLALVVGIALGFGMAMLLLGRDRVPVAPQQASAPTAGGRSPAEIRDEPIREVTEQTVASAPRAANGEVPPAKTDSAKTEAVKPDAVKTDAVKPDTAKPQTPRAVAATPAAAAPSANVKPRTEKPTIAASPRAAARRSETAVANTPPSRLQGKTPVGIAKTTPAPKVPASSTKGQTNAARAGSSTKASTPAASSHSAPAKPAATMLAKAAPQTPAKTGAGSLVVDSRPAGASVYLDGKRVGATPLVLDTLKVGDYTIGIDLDGYQRWATTVRVTSGERSRVAASLER